MGNILVNWLYGYGEGGFGVWIFWTENVVKWGNEMRKELGLKVLVG